MSEVETQTGTSQSSKFLYDLSGIDLNAVIADREKIARWNPHRGHMALLDAVVWQSPDLTRCIGVMHVKGDEFWVQGHFPGKPMLPGVLMVELGAQLANYLFNARTPTPSICALMAVDEASFRNPVFPGQSMYILLDSMKWSARRFASRVQGIVGDSVAFDCIVKGIAITAPKQVD
jgi:3-hydroxyacyl-[acyl-carrier-protein] dehydratase